MSKQINTEEIIKAFKKHKPTEYDSILHLGLELKYISEGAFRSVYRIKHSNLVVKLPHIPIPNTGEFDSDYDEDQALETNIQHSIDEVKNIRKVLRNQKYKALHRYMPNVYYSNDEGLILMDYYETFKKWHRHLDDICRMLQHLVDDLKLEKKWENDIHWANLGYDANGEIKLIDVGILS